MAAKKEAPPKNYLDYALSDNEYRTCKHNEWLGYESDHFPSAEGIAHEDHEPTPVFTHIHRRIDAMGQPEIVISGPELPTSGVEQTVAAAASIVVPAVNAQASPRGMCLKTGNMEALRNLHLSADILNPSLVEFACEQERDAKTLPYDISQVRDYIYANEPSFLKSLTAEGAPASDAVAARTHLKQLLDHGAMAQFLYYIQTPAHEKAVANVFRGQPPGLENGLSDPLAISAAEVLNQMVEAGQRKERGQPLQDVRLLDGAFATFIELLGLRKEEVQAFNMAKPTLPDITVEKDEDGQVSSKGIDRGRLETCVNALHYQETRPEQAQSIQSITRLVENRKPCIKICGFNLQASGNVFARLSAVAKELKCGIELSSKSTQSEPIGIVTLHTGDLRKFLAYLQKDREPDTIGHKFLSDTFLIEAQANLCTRMHRELPRAFRAIANAVDYVPAAPTCIDPTGNDKAGAKKTLRALATYIEKNATALDDAFLGNSTDPDVLLAAEAISSVIRRLSIPATITSTPERDARDPATSEFMERIGNKLSSGQGR